MNMDNKSIKNQRKIASSSYPPRKWNDFYCPRANPFFEILRKKGKKEMIDEKC